MGGNSQADTPPLAVRDSFKAVVHFFCEAAASSRRYIADDTITALFRAASPTKIVAVLGNLVDPLLLDAASLQDFLDGPAMRPEVWVYIRETVKLARRIASHNQVATTNAEDHRAQ